MSLPQRIIGQLQRQHAPGVTLFDMTAEFRAYAQATDQDLFFRRNTHWDREGNRLAAEVISRHIRATWFGQDNVFPDSLDQDFEPVEPLPVNPLLSEAEIAEYLAPLNAFSGPDGMNISGAVRPIHLVDGIIDQSDNWAIAPLNQPVQLRFRQPRSVKKLNLHLFNADGRTYRYTVEVETAGGWETLPAVASGGAGEWDLGGRDVSAMRITGLESTASPDHPTAGYLLIHEIEWTQ